MCWLPEAKLFDCKAHSRIKKKEFFFCRNQHDFSMLIWRLGLSK